MKKQDSPNRGKIKVVVNLKSIWRSLPVRISMFAFAMSLIAIGVFFIASEIIEKNADKKAVIDMDKQIENIDGASTVKKVARVGQEYIFLTDLNYYARFRGQAVDSIDKEKALDEIIQQSEILQAAARNGWVSLNTNIFNNPFKDYDKRMKTINSVIANYLAFHATKTSYPKWLEQIKSQFIIERY